MFRLEIDTSGSQFQEDEVTEVARLLAWVTEAVWRGELDGLVKLNESNEVGFYELVPSHTVQEAVSSKDYGAIVEDEDWEEEEDDWEDEDWDDEEDDWDDDDEWDDADDEWDDGWE